MYLFIFFLFFFFFCSCLLETEISSSWTKYFKWLNKDREDIDVLSYLCYSNGTNITAVWSCCMSSTNQTRDYAAKSFHCYPAIHRMWWRRWCAGYPGCGVVISYWFNDGGKSCGQETNITCSTHSRYSKLDCGKIKKYQIYFLMRWRKIIP